MASLSNINGIFDVHSTGAILFSNTHGTSGQILRSNGNAAPTWVAASTVIGGPYLPLTGGTLSGPLSGTSATFSGNVQGATFNGLAINTTGTNNVANQIVRTQANGYVNFGWINSISGATTSTITRITASNDAYLRYVTPATFRTQITDPYYAPAGTVSGVTSVATGNGLTGGTITTTGTLSLDRPNSQLGAVLATYGTTAGSAGRIRITAPFATNSAHMFSIEVTLYTSYTQYNYVVSGYMYPSTNQWLNPKAIYTTTGTATPDIYVGRDTNGKAYISIANGSYTGVLVHNMTRGYQTSLADTYDPWTIAVNSGNENSVSVATSQVWTTANLPSPVQSSGVTSVATGSGLTGGTITTTGTLSVDTTVIRTTGNQSMSGVKTFTTKVITPILETTGVPSRVKLTVWDGSTYGFGMESGYTFGALSNNYAITCQMSNTAGRGFWWGDSAHTNAQGAMALNTEGRLTVATAMRIGFGQTDTTSPSAYTLQANGTVYSANGNTAAFICGPNSSYGAGTELEIGGWNTGTTVSRIRNSNGNLHIDSKGGYTLYLNHYPAGNILTCNGGGYLMSYQSMRSPIFYDYLNTLYYGDFGSTTMGKYFGRQAHNEGFQVGSYNNVGENSTRSNPIYTIGSGYMPASTTLTNMYGIGYTHQNASFISVVGRSGWGMYVAADGDARVWLDGSSGRVAATGAMYSPIYYDTNTAYYGNFASTSRLNTLNCDGAITSGTSSTGNIYCGNASSTHMRLHVVGNTSYFDMNSGNISWRQGSSTRYIFYSTTANMTIYGTLTQGSDIRIKENIVEIGNCIDKVKSIRGVYYNRTDFNTEPTKIGVIAQEVEEQMPELVHDEPTTGIKSVSYTELTAVLVNAIKEQQVIIDDLKSRIEKLEL